MKIAFENAGKLRKYPLIVPLTLFSLLVLGYWRVPLIFFQQDEWMGFGLIIDTGIKLLVRGFDSPNILHFVPLGQLLNYLSFHLFGLNYTAYNIAGLLIHLANGYLVYILGVKIFQRRIYGLISGSIFLTSSIPSQLLMWPMVSLNTLSLTFTLLAWLMVFKTREGVQVFRFGLLAIFLALLAILTLEYSLGLLAFIPAIFILFYLQTRKREYLHLILIMILMSLIYLSVRLYPMFKYPQSGNVSNVSQGQILIFKVTRLPLKYTGQLFISEESVKHLSKIVAKWISVPEESLYGKITAFFGLVAVISSLLLFKIIKSKQLLKNQIVILLFIFFSFLPFLFLSGVSGNFSLFPPRYLYYGTVGSALLLTLILYLVNLGKNTALKIFALAALGIIVFMGIQQNNERSDQLVTEGTLRKYILDTIKNNYPTLTQRTIFYTRSDNSYYGLPDDELILPFQSGLGQILLIWYHSTQNFPQVFFQNKFLWEINSQGYKEADGWGFGYFRDIDLMVRTVGGDKITSSKLIAFSFDSSNRKLSDITQQVRGETEGYIANKQLIRSSELTLEASENSSYVNATIDGNRETFWQSEFPYDRHQVIKFDLGGQRNIAQIQVDSYNDKNQGNVGYKLYLSLDGYDWKEVFSAKRYPPNAQGLTDIYFQPQPARYLELRQIGNHRFASWVVSEFKLYEKVN